MKKKIKIHFVAQDQLNGPFLKTDCGHISREVKESTTNEIFVTCKKCISILTSRLVPLTQIQKDFFFENYLYMTLIEICEKTDVKMIQLKKFINKVAVQEMRQKAKIFKEKPFYVLDEKPKVIEEKFFVLEEDQIVKNFVISEVEENIIEKVDSKKETINGKIYMTFQSRLNYV